MPLSPGTRIGSYELTASIGTGGPASARAANARELWRGLAEAQLRPR